MSLKLISFNSTKVYNLGIKVFFAHNKKANQFFVVIADVNPSSCCYLENVSPGDILSSINGISIGTFDTFNNITKSITKKENSISQITIIKNGILDGTDLIKRIISSPCSELCQTWNEKVVKVSKKIEIVDKSSVATINPIFTIKSAKSARSDESISKSPIADRILEDQVSSGKLFASNNPKIKFHQKVPPATATKKSPTNVNSTAITVNYKSTKPSTREILSQPQPHFVKRLNSKWPSDTSISSDLKKTKSCDDLVNISETDKGFGTLSTVSSCDSLVERDQSTVTEVKMRKMNPNIARKPIKPHNRRSIELEDVFTTRIPMKFFDPADQVTVKNEAMFPDQLLVHLKKELLKINEKDTK